MNNGNGNGSVSNFTNSTVLRLISRLALLGITIIVPIIGWVVQRGVTTIDEVSHKVDALHDQSVEANGHLKLIQEKQFQQSTIIADHEARMRFLENLRRYQPPLRLPPN